MGLFSLDVVIGRSLLFKMAQVLFIMDCVSDFCM